MQQDYSILSKHLLFSALLYKYILCSYWNKPRAQAQNTVPLQCIKKKNHPSLYGTNTMPHTKKLPILHKKNVLIEFPTTLLYNTINSTVWKGSTTVQCSSLTTSFLRFWILYTHNSFCMLPSLRTGCIETTMQWGLSLFLQVSILQICS